ncbi:MAG: hypothetical protein Q9169_001748 [Polycauliona sp. 2 TL-2023]
MRAILPGKPQASLQALCTAEWEGLRLVVYISGNGLMILSGPNDLVQTIYHEDDDALIAVTIDGTSGKIATAGSREVHVYRPYGKEDGLLKWSLQCTIPRIQQDPSDVTLSWGTDEELLVGSRSLRLFQTAIDETEIWRRALSKPTKIAKFSYDATLIASAGHYDRLVKIWRRQSYGADDTRFDFTYLPHPTAVTAIHWRTPHTRVQASEHVLYTTCADHKLRIWAALDQHRVQVLQLWAEIDMLDCVQPRQLSPDTYSQDRFVFIIDCQDFARTTAATLEEAVKPGAVNGESKEQHALQLLAEIAKSSPEICVVLDRHGHMSAWGLENVGRKARKPTDIFNVAHVENFDLGFLNPATSVDGNTQLVPFCWGQPDAPFVLLAHYFDGRIEWLECRLEELFAPFPQQKRTRRKILWTGHDEPIRKIVRSASGKAVVSRTNNHEALIWAQGFGNSDLGLTRRSSLECAKNIRRSWLLQEGHFLVTLHDASISLWDARQSPATQVGHLPIDIEGHPICLVQLPKTHSESQTIHLATITSNKLGIVWQLRLPGISIHQPEAQHRSVSEMRYVCAFELDINDIIAFMMPIDPAGSAVWTTSSLDTFSKDIAISCSPNGKLRTWTAALDSDESTVEWLVTSTVETGIKDPSLASASSIRKTALVDGSKAGLTIWDMRSGQVEYSVQYGDLELIQDLDWSSTPDDQALLAVGFPHTVMVLAQMRYDYLNAGPAWAPIRRIDIKESTPHPIGDSTWLGNGNLLVGAGNQLFIYDKSVESSDDMISDLALPVHKHGKWNLFDLVTILNGPLPLFHPQFISQCVLAGKLGQVHMILHGLHKALKFFTEGDTLDSHVSLSPDIFTVDTKMLNNGTMDYDARHGSIDEAMELNIEEVAASLNEELGRTLIPQLSNQEQTHLIDMVECVSTVIKHQRSMDENATRYLLFFRQHMIRKSQLPLNRACVTYREIVWAFHSGSQDILVDLTTRQSQGRMLWEDAKNCGLSMWINDVNALRAQFEVIARNEYAKTDEKNPIDCSLFYLALRKKNVLVGLWRMAAWNREQASTQRLLSNNFQEARWKTAALKNAYALLGKRRFEYAAAFFLLAGNLQDAVNVCLHHIRDVQLAVAVARMYEGDNGPVLRLLLTDKVLPQAALEGDRWLATWAFWMLGKRDLALRSLISPLHTLLDTPERPKLQARSYLANDPALVVLYTQLRGKTLQTLKGASRISPKEEWDFVIQNARLYDRMGCDLLALDLVRNWEFLLPTKELPSQTESPPDPRKMLRRRSSLVVDDLSSPKSPTGMKTGVGKPPPQKVFEEPEANSLLDNFGF